MHEPQGMLRVMRFDGKGGAEPVAPERLQADAGAADGCWIHLDYSNAHSVGWLKRTLGLDDVVVEALCSVETRPRVMAVNGGLLIALRGVNLNPGAEPEDMVAVRLWIDGRRVISSLRRRMASIDELAEALHKGAGPQSPAAFLVALCAGIVGNVEPVLEEAEDRIDDLEDRLVEARTETLRQDLAVLRRRVIGLHRYLSPQREAIGRLVGEHLTWLAEDERLDLRETGDRLVRQIEDLDLIRERAALTIEELYSQLSEQLNHRLYVLSIAAAIFLPLTFVTGLLGINVGGIPGAHAPWGFLAVVVLMLLILAGQLWLLRRWRWL